MEQALSTTQKTIGTTGEWWVSGKDEEKWIYHARRSVPSSGVHLYDLMLNKTLLEVSGWGGERERWWWHEGMSNQSVSCRDVCPGRRTAAHWLSAPAAHLQSGQTVMKVLMERQSAEGGCCTDFPHRQCMLQIHIDITNLVTGFRSTACQKINVAVYICCGIVIDWNLTGTEVCGVTSNVDPKMWLLRDVTSLVGSIWCCWPETAAEKKYRKKWKATDSTHQRQWKYPPNHQRKARIFVQTWTPFVDKTGTIYIL